MKYEIAIFGMFVLFTLGNCASGPHIIGFMSGRYLDTGRIWPGGRTGIFNLTEEVWELAVNVNMAAWWVITWR